MMGKSLGTPMGLRCKQSWGTQLTNLLAMVMSVPSTPTQSSLDITKLWNGLVTNELIVLEEQ